MLKNKWKKSNSNRKVPRKKQKKIKGNIKKYYLNNKMKFLQ